MLELYIDQVIRLIHVGERDEVEAKLRSRLAKLLGEKTDDESVQKIIEYLGKPESLAREYQSNEYLIGPNLYVAYKKVLGILLRVVLILFGVSNLLAIFIVSIVSFNFSDLISKILGLLPQLISIILYIVAIITLFFTFLEKYMENTTKKIVDAITAFEFKNMLREIEKVFKSKEGKIGYFSKPVAGIKIIIVAMLIGLISSLIGYDSNGSVMGIFNISILAEYQIYIMVVCIGYIILNILKIMFQRWNWSFAIFNTILMGSFFFLIMTVLQDQRIVNVSFLETIEIVIAGTIYQLVDVWQEVVYIMIATLFTIVTISALFGFFNAFLVYRENRKEEVKNK